MKTLKSTNSINSANSTNSTNPTNPTNKTNSTKTIYKRQTYMGTIGDIKMLEQHFSIMAEKGWMIDKIGVSIHRYRAIEPCKMRFFIDLFSKITAFDYPESESVQRYRKTYEDAGWAFAAANRQIQVFYTTDMALPPVLVDTDNSEQAKTYLKTSLKLELPYLILSLPIFYFLFPISKGYELFLSDLSILMTIGWLLFMIMDIWTLGFVLSWFWRTVKSARHNLPLPSVSYRLSRARIRIFSLFACFFFLLVIIGVILEFGGKMSPIILLYIFAFPILGVAAGLIIRWQINTRKRERKENRRIAIISIVVLVIAVYVVSPLITLPQIPATEQTIGNRAVVTLADFGATSPPESSYMDIKGSFAVPVNYHYTEINAQGSVATQVYKATSKTLARGLYNSLAKTYPSVFYDESSRLDSSEAAFWGADDGVAFNSNNGVVLLLVKDKTILRISYSFAPYAADLAAAAKATAKLWQ